ncbi:MAG: YbaK/EbsC family protein [Planctomycetaceae bacterium]
MTVFERITQLLTDHSADYQVLHHEPVYTSEEAARVRGTSLSSGAKALICKCGVEMRLFVMPADRRLDSKAVRRQFGWRKMRFATPDEVLELTGLKPGSIPPFGSLFDLPVCCDSALAVNERINFNAGEHAVSISLLYSDYVRIEQPPMATIAE